jgi:hypothetical protein
MSAVLVLKSKTDVPRKNPRGRRRVVGWHRAAVLEPKHRQLHAQLRAEGRPMSGRAGGYVYYWAYGRLCWRRHVTPKDPRTAAQRLSRAAFGAASKAWSHDPELTEAQRGAWSAQAAQIQSRPRLMQSGPLTAQQHFVGCHSVKQRWGQNFLLDPPERASKWAKGTSQQAATSASHARILAGSASDTRRNCTVPVPCLPRVTRTCAAKRTGKPVLSQVARHEPLARPSSERPWTTTGRMPVQYRRCSCSVWSIGLPGLVRGSHIRGLVPRHACFCRRWRGS